MRDRALKFLINKIKLLPEVTKDVENLIVAESLKVGNVCVATRQLN